MNVRKLLLATIAIAASAFQTPAQNLPGAGAPTGQTAQTATTYKPGNAWKLMWPIGLHEPSTLDTLRYNYQRQAIPSLVSNAYATTGNLGAEGQTQIFFDRKPYSAFFFENALAAWLPSFENQRFYNVYIPFTQLSYNTGGNRLSNQDRLRAVFAGNVNRRIGIGASMDYLYSKGSYEDQATKDFTFGFEGYYTGERYEMQAFYNHFNFLNKENGGITNDLYITDPAEIQGGVSKVEPKSIPTNLTDAHSRLIGDEFYMSHAFKVGYWREEEVNDTLTRDVYVPMIKFIYAFDYRSGHHLFLNTSAAQEESFWKNHYVSLTRTDDNSRYRELSNTVGVSMVEGFRKWVKFGLSAYATYRFQHFRQTAFNPEESSTPGDQGEGDEVGPLLTPLPEGFSIDPKASRSDVWVGGMLTKQQGTLLNYTANVRFGIVGSVAGDFEAEGTIGSRFRLGRDTVAVSANAHFRNTAQPYLMQHYISNHYAWDNDFGKTRSFRVEGALSIPWTRTQISAGVQNIQNYVYINTDGLPQQHGGNVQVFSASLQQQLHFGIWNWDNSVTYQRSSDRSIISLPELALYSNMYLNFRAFRVLDLQIGVDCNYYTSYYAPLYRPSTMLFARQEEKKVGNYPFCNAYITAKLYKVRFYLLWSHVNQGWFGSGYFSMPGYPLNPRRFLLGLSIDFTN